MNMPNSPLVQAIDGEFNAIRKYKAYRDVAMEQGFAGIANLFQALAMGETIHLENHKRAFKGEYSPRKVEINTGTTLENVMDARATEQWEYKRMYPDLIKKVRGKGLDTDVTRLSLKWAMEAEKFHARVLRDCIDMLKRGKDFPFARVWVCRACGNLHVGPEPPDRVCPICKHDPAFYKEVGQAS